MRHFLTFSFLVFSLLSFSQKNNSSDKYLPNTLMVKVKESFRNSCTTNGIQHKGINQSLKSIGVQTVQKEFPNHTAPLRKKNNAGIPLADLSLIYKITYSGKLDAKNAGAKLMATGYFEYAEVFFLHEVLFTPDDPEIGSQYHITNINAYQAWDVAQGDTNVVIGISDTGIELTHPDIAGNLKKNYADPIDGIDNDGDGYLDNFDGWDTGENDNDPSWNVSKHGHSVSGTAAAITNNANQVAGVAFKAKVLPLKITNSFQQLTGSYSSIVYGADHGCKIINCSWGTANAWSQFGQDVITYAAINKNCLVVCAAGNDNNTGVFYPASFDWALSVGGTNSSNTKWVSNATYGSNYNEHVDICAPGHDIYTITTGGATISGRSGTSFSAPIVSGAASLVWGQDLTQTGMQVGEILKATADSLEFIPGNGAYSGKLGEGLLNCQRSVTETGFPGLYLYNFQFSGNNQGKLAPGDTVTAGGTLVNFLSASSAGTVAKISTNSPHINLITSEITIGSLANFGSYDLSTTPFKFEVLPTMPIGEIVEFTFTFTDGTYNTKRHTAQQFFIDYVDLNVNNVGTSIGSSGKVGYNKLGVQTPGLGFTYNASPSLLYHYGFIAADNSSQVSYVLDGDFDTESAIDFENPGIESDFDVYTHFNDDSAAANKLAISVKQKSLAWDNPKDENFVLFEYTVINNSGATYNNLHIGMYVDWDIGAVIDNDAAFDGVTNTAYTKDATGVFGGIHLLDGTNIQHYAYNNDGSGGSANVYDGHSEAEQFFALTNGNSRPNAGTGDVSQMIGNGPYTVANGDSVVFVIAVIAGDDLTDIQNSALAADTAYRKIRTITISTNSTVAPTCDGFCDGSISISALGGIGTNYTYLWDDPSAQTTADANGLCAGTYSCIVTDSIGNQDTIKSIVLSNPAPVSVALGNDSTICSGGSSFLWSTGAVSQQITVSTANTYHVAVTTGAGCVGRDTINVFTGSLPTVNLGNDTTICSGQSVSLDAGNIGSNYLWDDASVGQTKVAATNGIHWVQVTNLSNCSARDSINITVNALPTVDLGADVIACDTYNGTLDAGNPGASYLWNTGGTGQTIAITSTGSYFVTVTLPGNCIGKDTMNLTVENTPVVNLGNDTSVCKSANFTLDAGVASAYVWSTGEKTQSIPTYFEGQYFVTAGINCIDKDTINISFKADPLVWSLSSFNPVINSSEGDVLLDFGQPIGGTYSGTGVTGNIFNTVNSGDGLFKIDYLYTDPSTGCAANTWLEFDVNPTNSVVQLANGIIQVFPNPFNNYFTVAFSGTSNLDAVIYDLYDGQGKLVQNGLFQLTFQDAQFVIETSNLSSGLYHLILRTDNFHQDIKLTK